MKLNLLKTGLLAVVVLVLYACGGGGEKKEESSASSEFDSAKKQVEKDVEQVIKDLPPPSEVPYLLISAGAEFNETLVNPIEKIPDYMNDADKSALNLGVYAADIGYLSYYEKSETALDYMGECQKLASPVGIADAVDYGMVARFESNMENRDSLTAIINEVMDTAGSQFSQLDQLNSAALMLAGSWIEGVFISTSIVSNYKVEGVSQEDINIILEKLILVVLKQKKSLNDLLIVMKDVPSSDAIKSTTADLEKVKGFYDGELAEVEKKIAENTGEYNLSTAVLANITAEVNRIRTSIVE